MTAQVVEDSWRQMSRDRTFRLLIPLLIFNGFEQGFVYADYNKVSAGLCVALANERRSIFGPSRWISLAFVMKPVDFWVCACRSDSDLLLFRTFALWSGENHSHLRTHPVFVRKRSPCGCRTWTAGEQADSTSD